MMLHRDKLPEVSCSNMNILQIKSTSFVSPMDCASGFSSKAVSVMQSFSEDVHLDKSAPAQGVLYHSTSVSDTLRNFPDHIESAGPEKYNINLWSGSPPKWVEKFEVSNCFILNLIAQLYAKFEADGLLSSILQSLVSLFPIIWGSNSDELAEPGIDLCELLLQYIDHKIDSDIEELYLCCRLLERLTMISNFFSEVYAAFLSSLQVSVSENYGGTLQLTYKGITNEKEVTKNFNILSDNS